MIASTLPAVLPFVFLSDPHFALRVSNALLIGMLFLVGQRWARYTTLRPWLTGLTFMTAGLALVVIAIELGG